MIGVGHNARKPNPIKVRMAIRSARYGIRFLCCVPLCERGRQSGRNDQQEVQSENILAEYTQCLNLFSSADNLRAVTSGLRHFASDVQIRKGITSVARVQPIDDYVALVQRGLTEMRTWIGDKGSAKLRAAAVIGDGEHA